MASIFTKIIAGEIPAHIIAETPNCIAFLDVFPLAEGHCLVVPKNEIDYIFDIEDGLYQELFSFSKKISKALKKTIPCRKVGMAIIGLEVPHAHIHLIPINQVADINFSSPKLTFSDEHLAGVADRIKSNL